MNAKRSSSNRILVFVEKDIYNNQQNSLSGRNKKYRQHKKSYDGLKVENELCFYDMYKKLHKVKM